MTCPQCRGLETLFDDKTAAKELKEYRKKGPRKTTQLLIDALKAKGVENLTLLDIGGGVGVIQHELMKAGARAITNIDASSAYIAAAKSEATRQDYLEQASYRFGDFVELSSDQPAADIVTLDRSICCYPDMVTLVGLSSERALKFYGLVYPRDTWPIKAVSAIVNVTLHLFWKDYRFFIHPTEAVESVIGDRGLKRCFYQKTFLWQIAIYSR